jgi:hypothetical protein
VRTAGRRASPPPDIAAWRRASRAALYRSINREQAPVSWGLRLWNGRGEQMLTLFFPNPYYDAHMRRQRPDWRKLELWNDLRARFLGLPPDAHGRRRRTTRTAEHGPGTILFPGARIRRCSGPLSVAAPLPRAH